MDISTKPLHIDSGRMQRDFESLLRIGSTHNGGVHRPAFSEADLAARQWFEELALKDGFAFSSDGAGNCYAKLVHSASAGSLLFGSHLDSVPQGGRFDGALGVVAAYEVLRTIRDSNAEKACNLEVVNFADEEGTLVGLLGSRAIAGKLPLSELMNPRGGKLQLRQALDLAGLTQESVLAARRDPKSILAYLELHIEQGPRLKNSNSRVGIVTGVVGIRSFAIKFIGRADHAGTTPMDARRDSGLGASEFILSARTKVVEGFPDSVINFGGVTFLPGAFNIVPSEATLLVEFRSPGHRTLDLLEVELLDLAQKIGKKYELDVACERYLCVAPTSCSPVVQKVIASSCRSRGLTSVYLTSGAGHDAMSLADLCPVGMIFIPSTGGSHSSTEFAEWEDCTNGANVLLESVLGLLALISETGTLS